MILHDLPTLLQRRVARAEFVLNREQLDLLQQHNETAWSRNGVVNGDTPTLAKSVNGPTTRL